MTRLTRTQSGSRRTPRLVTATAFVLALLGVTAFLGGLEMLIWPMGSDVLPGTLLDDLPVDSFLIPGILLASLFGIGASVVAYGLWRQPYLPSMRWIERATGRHWAWAATQVVGWALAAWMVLELVLLGAPWTGAPIERATAWTVYGIYLAMAAWLIASPWTAEVRDDLHILDLTAIERTPEPSTLTSRRVLVAYGSERFGTAELAVLIGEHVERRGFYADVRAAPTVESVDGYGAVIVGGAVHAGTWHRHARTFARRHREALRQRPVWLFSSGPLDDPAAHRTTGPVWQARIAMDRVTARGHVTFGRLIEADAHGWIASSVAATMAGDWRDVDHVAQWVETVVAHLRPLLPREDVLPTDDRPPTSPTPAAGPRSRRRRPIAAASTRMTMTPRPTAGPTPEGVDET